MFRDDVQRVEVCMRLLEPIGLSHLWSLVGDGGRPGATQECANMYLGEEVPPLSHGECAMFFASWVVWNGGREGRRPSLDEVLYGLDGENLALLGSFMIAYAAGSTMIDRWLEAHRK